jgi:hypothetical protein
MSMATHPGRIPTLAGIALLGAAAACNGNGKDEESLEPCSAVSVAGDDQSVVLNNAVNLSATGSSLEGSCAEDVEISYTWRFDAVPVDSSVDESSLTYNNTADAVNTVFLPDVVGDYVLSVEACVETACSAPDPVVVQVYSGDAAPIADAGLDITAEIDERVTLDGSASYDPERSTLDYSWGLVTVPGCSALGGDESGGDGIFEPDTVDPYLVPDCEGIYLVALVVSDGVQWSEPDYSTIRVASGDAQPVADAGESGEIAACDGDRVVLSGYGSFDPDGVPLEYLWSLVSVPLDSTVTDGAFSDVTSAAPSFVFDVEGEYVFQLQVSDGTWWSAPDVVTFLVHGANSNSPPVAIITGNLTIARSVQCSTSNYVWTCDMCGEEEFDLDGSSSYDQNDDELSYYWEEPTGELTWDGIPEAAFISLATGAIQAEYGVTHSQSWDVSLTVADCDLSSTNQVQVTFSCEGTQ